ncbi:MAG: hypothetical protein ABSF08_12425, partial [Candidatus Cybelea sp.]
MKRLNLSLPGALLLLAVAFLAGCGGPVALRQPFDSAQGDTVRLAQGGAQRDVTLTMPHYMQRTVHSDR